GCELVEPPRRHDKRANGVAVGVGVDVGASAHSGHVRLADAIDRAQGGLDLARIHGRSLDLEHVVASAVVPEVTVRIEHAAITCRIETVSGEGGIAGATDDCAHDVAAAHADLTDIAGGHRHP